MITGLSGFSEGFLSRGVTVAGMNFVGKMPSENVMNTSLKTMSLTEDCTLNEFVFQAWWPLDFIGYHHTRSVPILVLVGDELQTHIQDDNLFN